MPRKVERRTCIQAPATEVFDALITPSDIKKWWSATSCVVLGEKGGFISVSWGPEDSPDYITHSRILEIDRPKKLILTHGKYFSRSGELPFEAIFIVTYSLKEREGETILVVTQSGFPDSTVADSFLAETEKGWTNTLEALKNHIEEN